LLKRAACAPERRASRGASHPSRISSAGFSGSVHSTQNAKLFLRSFTCAIETRSLQTRPPRLLLDNSPRVFVYAKSSGPFGHLNGNKPAGRIRKEMRPAPFRLALRWPSLAVGLRPPWIGFQISKQHL
jgi:hypothetical protein